MVLAATSFILGHQGPPIGIVGFNSMGLSGLSYKVDSGKWLPELGMQFGCSPVFSGVKYSFRNLSSETVSIRNMVLEGSLLTEGKIKEDRSARYEGMLSLGFTVTPGSDQPSSAAVSPMYLPSKMMQEKQANEEIQLSFDHDQYKPKFLSARPIELFASNLLGKWQVRPRLPMLHLKISPKSMVEVWFVFSDLRLITKPGESIPPKS